jgi:hypothetical protein
MELEFKKKTLGRATCPDCGFGGASCIQTKKGRTLIQCPPEGDGGCNQQFFARGETSMRAQVRRITQWNNAADKVRLLGSSSPSSSSSSSSSSSEPKAETPEERRAREHRELFGE